MRKIIIPVCATVALSLLWSCGSSKSAATVASLEGEWNIIEVNGSAVVPAPNQSFPFIAFDTHAGRVSGNSGCNRLSGTFDVNAKPGTLDLGKLVSTRMACPDMTLEQKVLGALAQVKQYRTLGDGTLALCGASSSKPMVVLQQKKRATHTLEPTDLNGTWSIVKINGQAIPSGLEKKPSMEFNVEDKRISATAGCNRINSAFVLNSRHGISFLQSISTQMACPDMRLEAELQSALSEVRSYRSEEGGIALCDAGGKTLLLLKK
ncbi:MAG: META domain-containing protein [Prevotellaceae bacterium]|jgi:heat shock protein HslJ|nr:META domain-containing protein [Prevotellaceae bacterium]